MFQISNPLKKHLALVLVTMLLVSLTLTPFADSLATAPVLMPYDQYLVGDATVKSPLSDNRLLVTIEKMEVALNIGDKTLVIDAKTGLPANLTTLKAGDKLVVYYSAAMTKSLPPQSFAFAIVTNIEANQTRPAFFVVKSIEAKNADGIRVLNTAGDLIVAIDKKLPITPFKTKQIVGLQDIRVGSILFVWYDIVAMSYPGQTGAKKVVYVGQEPDLELTINGKTIDLEPSDNAPAILQDINGQAMIQLRAAANTLGFKLDWNSKLKVVAMDNGSVKTSIVIGEDNYYKASSKAIGLTQSLPLGAAPYLVNNRIYVPLSLFNLLYSDEAVTLTRAK